MADPLAVKKCPKCGGKLTHKKRSGGIAKCGKCGAAWADDFHRR
jgi:ribosomal protein L37AE/L43A